MTALTGIRVVELANERISWAGKLMADMGAEVILLEPPGGCTTREHPPFHQTHTDQSLHFWHYNTSKKSVQLDIEHDRELFIKLVATADVLLESEPTTRLSGLNLDYPTLSQANPDLIHIAVTPYGRENPLSDLPTTDLTLMAAGGPPWSCGYDDHSLPPMRGWGNQGFHTGCHFAFMSALTALLARNNGMGGQFIDVSIVAALNVTTEAASYTHNLNGQEVQRQTGRHAAVKPTGETQMQCSDGQYVNTGVPPRFPVEFSKLLAWLEELELIVEFPEHVFLEMGAEWQGHFDLGLLGTDDTVTAIFSAGRQALQLVASKVSAYEFFIGCQNAGLTVGAINRPEQAFEDPHIKARGFQHSVHHPDLQETYRYPGAPYLMNGSPWQISSPAPKLGEHNQEVLAELT